MTRCMRIAGRELWVALVTDQDGTSHRRYRPPPKRQGPIPEAPGMPRSMGGLSQTPRTAKEVSYIHASPGCAIKGRVANRRIHPSGVCGVAGLGGPGATRSVVASRHTGVDTLVTGNPKPIVQVSRCRTVTARRASSVSSTSASIRRRTRRLANSGIIRSMGSSRLQAPRSAPPTERSSRWPAPRHNREGAAD